MTATILIVVVLAVSVISVFASRSAQQGQFLYPLKQICDQIELFLTPAHEAKARIRFKILEGHTQQVQIATIRSDFDEVIDEGRDFREEVEEVEHDIDEISQTGAKADNIKSQLRSLIDNEINSLKTAADKASGKDTDSINQEIQLTQMLQNK